MFFKLFSKRRPVKPFNFKQLKVDMHSHVLPGIDDGAMTLSDSVELIKGMHELGYSKLIVTPHIYWNMYKNTVSIIKGKTEAVRKALLKYDIPINIETAAEYFLDDHLAGLIQKKLPLLTMKDNMVLTEFSTMQFSPAMKTILFDLQMAGYKPIIAHPERYTYLHQKMEVLHELKDKGCLFQLNLLSLTGNYGKIVTEMAEYLIQNGFYSLIGTDLHHPKHLEQLQKYYMRPSLQSLIESDNIINSSL